MKFKVGDTVTITDHRNEANFLNPAAGSYVYTRTLPENTQYPVRSITNFGRVLLDAPNGLRFSDSSYVDTTCIKHIRPLQYRRRHT